MNEILNEYKIGNKNYVDDVKNIQVCLFNVKQNS